MNQPNPNVIRAYRLLQQRNLREAEAVCREELSRSPRDASVLQLLGLVRMATGDLIESERLLRASIDLDPQTADYHVNLANLLRRLQRLPDAERGYRKALAANPDNGLARLGLVRTLNDLGLHAAAEAECRVLVSKAPADPQAWSALAMTLRDQNRLSEAEAAYRKAIEIEPRHAAVHHNLGSLFVRMERAEEALAALERAQSLGLQGFEPAFNRARALLMLYRIDEAEQAFSQAIALEPRHIEAHTNLARIRYMRGDPDFARTLAAAAATHPDDTSLQIAYAAVLRRGGDLQRAEALLRELLVRKGPQPEVRSELAALLYEGGRLEEAETEALEAVTAKPGDSVMIETLVSIMLGRGRPADALPFIRTQRSRYPNVQNWIAYEATAARLMGAALYRNLYDYDRLVRVYDLETPPGWSSMAELNAAVLHALEARHRFATHPLDQSLRNGSQTARSLVTDPDPAIQAVLQAFAGPIADYRRAIGTDPGHPLTARNRGATTITGAWSVQLRREGFHVNHVHPQGWISSAYYVAVPEETADVQLMSGWLKFGETRFPVPGAGPERVVQPVPGRLALFPSYMWHGTNPIHGPDPRTTIAFDANPTESA